MSRPFVLLSLFVLLSGGAFAAILENGTLRVEFGETNGVLAVTDKRTSRVWRSMDEDHPISVTKARTAADEIAFEGIAGGVRGTLFGKVALDGETVRCSLDAPADAAFAADDASLVGWPAGFAAEKGDRYLLPHGSGFSFDAEETDLGERFDARMHGYSREWRMGLWAQYAERIAADGEILGAGGYMAVVETPCNSIGFYLKRANGRMGFSCLWENDLGTWGHERCVRFEFLEECSPMTVALRYRGEMKKKGYYRLFAEKAKDRPKMAENFRRLAGAPSVWYWAIDGDKAGVCRYLREKCGFSDFLFQFAKRKDLGVWVTPEEVKACAEAAPGVLLTEYDIYKDSMEKKYLPLIEYVRPYWSLEAADNDDIVYDAAGQAVRGWKVALKGDFDGFGKGLGCATVCERTIARYVRTRLTGEMGKYPWYTGRYLDATGCFAPFECYHARHRMSRRDCVRYRREMMAIPGDEYGLLSSTEDGQDFLASVCDYFTCGFSAANDYRVDGGRWMWKIYDGEPPDAIRRGTDERTRMPIFEMVYHGCCVSYWDWCDYNFKFPKIWWKRDLFNALCGTPPLYFFNEETWKRFRDRLKASYDVTTPVARATYSTPMTAYRILTPDRSVHRVEFANGVASTVNFGDRPFTMKDGFVLSAHGHRFEGEDVGQRSGCLVPAADEADDYAIVHADDIAAHDRFVVNDVSNLLVRAAGGPLKVCGRAAAPASKRIFYGIAPEGFDCGSLVDQERCVVVRGGDVYLFGGGVNGARYAAYDFLQNVLGYKFIDARGGMVVPPRSAFSLKPMERRSRFSFALRQISWAPRCNGPEAALFLFRHGYNGHGLPAFFDQVGLGKENVVADWLTDSPGDATIERVWLPACDRKSRWKYVHKYGMNLREEHPEYFGKMPDGTPDFSLQCCLSEPGARAEIRRRVMDRLAELPPNSVVDVSAGDHDGPFCRCPKCQELVKKYGSNGGPLYDWFLEVCPEVAKRFPDKYLMSLAYRRQQTQRPPTGIDRMPDNFIPDFAPIEDDFIKDWNDPFNQETRRDLEGWCRLCRHVRMWYYPNPYQERVTPPLGNIGRLVNDIRIMHAAGADQIGFEHNVGVRDMTGFAELQTYVMLRLFDDVTLDADRLTDDYLGFEYGAAAEEMKAYLSELERIARTTDVRLRWNPRVNSYLYLTGPRFRKWSDAFDRMEAKLADDPARLGNLRRVRINLDLALLNLHFKARKEDPGVDSVDQIAQRVRLEADAVCQAAFSGRRKAEADGFRTFVRRQLTIGAVMAKADPSSLPKDLFGQVKPEKVFVTVPRAVGKGYLDDGDAAYGVVACYENPDKPERMLKPFVPYLYDVDRRKPDWGVGGEAMKGPKPGSRGKFVFYRMAPMTLKPNCFVCFGHDTGHDIMGDLGQAYEEGSFNKVTVWLSLKFEGEHYYAEDAGKPNRIFCDRIVVVRE